jgi:cell division protein FtsL
MSEMDKDRQVVAEKKKQEKEYFNKIMEENSKNKEMAKKLKQKEKLEDVAA